MTLNQFGLMAGMASAWRAACLVVVVALVMGGFAGAELAVRSAGPSGRQIVIGAEYIGTPESFYESYDPTLDYLTRALRVRFPPHEIRFAWQAPESRTRLSINISFLAVQRCRTTGGT